MEQGEMQAFCPVCIGNHLGARQPGEIWDPEFIQREIQGVFGAYQIQEMVGRGGMGIVFKALDSKLGRVVALKVLQGGLFSAPIEVLRFQSEALLVASLQHPHIVTIHEADVIEGQPFIAMEFVGHRSLAAFAGRPAEPTEAARLCLEVCEAIAHAHSRAVIHRDLKPSNVLLDAVGHAKVVDFGLARRTDSTQDLTLTGQILGTPAFMAPEQADPSLGQVEVRSDIYGIGAILYFLLTGRPPFEAPTLPLLLELVLRTDPVLIRAIQSEVPLDLETVAMKCLSKDRTKRYGTAESLAEDLRRFLRGEPVLARPMGASEKAWRWVVRHRALTIALVLGICAVGAGIAAMVNAANSRITRRQAQLFNYVANVSAANRALSDGNLGFAVELLDQVHPGPGEADLRSVDWGYVRTHAVAEDDLMLDLKAGPLRYIALDPTGTRFAAVGVSNLVVRAFTNGGPEFRVPIPSRRYSRMARWHPDGNSVLLNETNGLVRYFPGSSRTEVWPIGNCTHFVLSPSGDRVAHCDIPEFRDNDTVALKVWSLRTLSTEATHPALGGALARWDTTNQLTCMDRNGAVWEWNLKSREARPRLTGERQVSTAAFASRDGWIARGVDRSGTVELRQIDNPRGVGSIAGIHEASFLAFSSDATWLFSTAADLRVHFSRLDPDTATWRTVFSKQGHREQVTGVESFPDRNSVVSCSEDGTVRTWSVGEARYGRFAANTLAGSYSGLRGPMLSPDGGWAAVPSSVDLREGTLVRLWSLRDGTFSQEILLTPIAFSPDSRRLLGYKATQEFEFWDVEKSALIRTFKIGQDVGSHSVDLSAGGDWLAILRSSRDEVFEAFTLFHLASGESYHPFGDDPVEFFVLARSANVLLATFKDGVRVLDLTSRTARRISGTYSESPAISPDGTLCALGTFENRIEIVRTLDGRVSGELIGHQAAILSLQFSSDNRTLVSTSNDQTIRFWNMATMRQTAVSREPYPIESIDLAHDNSVMMVWNSEGFEAVRIASDVMQTAAIGMRVPARSIWGTWVDSR
jgi:WD40 repeat protein